MNNSTMMWQKYLDLLDPTWSKSKFIVTLSMDTQKDYQLNYEKSKLR